MSKQINVISDERVILTATTFVSEPNSNTSVSVYNEMQPIINTNVNNNEVDSNFVIDLNTSASYTTEISDLFEPSICTNEIVTDEYTRAHDEQVLNCIESQRNEGNHSDANLIPNVRYVNESDDSNFNVNSCNSYASHPVYVAQTPYQYLSAGLAPYQYVSTSNQLPFQFVSTGAIPYYYTSVGQTQYQYYSALPVPHQYIGSTQPAYPNASAGQTQYQCSSAGLVPFQYNTNIQLPYQFVSAGPTPYYYVSAGQTQYMDINSVQTSNVSNGYVLNTQPTEVNIVSFVGGNGIDISTQANEQINEENSSLDSTAAVPFTNQQMYDETLSNENSVALEDPIAEYCIEVPDGSILNREIESNHSQGSEMGASEVMNQNRMTISRNGI